jgi:hypothetical protein
MGRICALYFCVALGMAGCDDDQPAPGPDLAVEDLATPPDLSMPADLAVPRDLVVEADGPLPVLDLAMPDLAMCTANAFLSCNAGDAIYCNGAGNGVTVIDCGAGGCTGNTGCGQCVANQKSCATNTETTCDAFERSTTRNCPLGCTSDSCTTCVAGQRSCNGAMTQLVTCNGDGISTTSSACSMGCFAGSGDGDAGALAVAHCGSPAWSNDLTLDCSALTSTIDLDVMANGLIDPQIGSINGVAQAAPVFTTKTQTGTGTPPELGVFRLKSLRVRAGQTLSVVGGDRAVALVVDGNVTIEGTLDAAAHLTVAKTLSVPGPGAAAGAEGFGFGGSTNAGAGGGAYGTSGGAGGNRPAPPNPAGTPGAAYPLTDPVSLSPLRYGGHGGLVGLGTNPRGKGGGGVQIISCGVVTVAAGGLINASGGGAPTVSAFQGGGGGGAGGAVLLEAPTVSVAGTIAVTGGGGAGGGVASGSLPPVPGNDGATDFACTTPGSTGGPGATFNGAVGGAGGNGACGTTPAQNGGVVTAAGTETPRAGGGGGGAGRVRINAISAPTVGAQSITPMLTETVANFTTGTLTIR